jgi:hypothetical protein
LEQYARIQGIKSLMQEQQIRQLQVQEAQQAQQDQQKIRSVLADPSIDWTDPEGAIQTVTQKAVAARVSPDALEKIRGSLITEANKFVNYHKDKQAQTLADNDLMYQHATSLLQAPLEQKEAMYQQIRNQLIQSGKATQDTLPPQYPGDQWTSVMRGTLGLTSAMFTTSQQAAEQKAKEREAIAKATMAEQEAKLTPEERANLKSKAEGQGSEFERSFQRQFGRMPTQDELIKFRKATQPPQVLSVQTVDAAGNPVTSIVPKQAGTSFPSKPTSDEVRRADLANNMEENLNQLEEIVKRRPELFGPIAGRMTSAKRFIGTDDPDVAALGAIKEYLGMASVGTHAMRNAQHVVQAANAVMNSYKNDPQAVLAAIQAARNSIQTFKNDVTGGRGQVPSGAPETTLPEGTIRTSRKTGKREVLKGGQWQSL